jgi:hypothetical protein
MFRPVLIDAHFVGGLVGEDEISQEFLLEFHSSSKTLAIRPNFRLQNDKIEAQRLGLYDAVDELSETGLASAGEENRQGIFLLHAQLNQIDLSRSALLILGDAWPYDLLIPTILPAPWLFHFNALTSR